MEQLVDTDLVYLKNTYEFETTARILKFDKDEKGPYIILDRTLFYPQGGGQPSDLGQILTKDFTFNINFVSFNNGLVHHYFSNENGGDNLNYENLVGLQVDLKVDSSRRINNAKSHTSGHLLASIVENLAPEITATKGYHFPEGPYIEFKGKLTTMSSEDLIAKTHAILKEDIELARKVIVVNETDESLTMNVVGKKKMRMVKIDGYNEVPCGGTHLKNISELKEVAIRKIQFPKGNTKIAYSYS